MMKLIPISDGINVTKKQIQAKLKDVCPVCATTRALYKIPKGPTRRSFKEFGELITLDTWGPYPVLGLQGERYALTLVDEGTRFTWTTLFKTKDEIAPLLIERLKRLATKFSPVVRICADNEFA